MSLTTFSAFTYGHDIDDNSNYIDFSEDGITELSAVIETGSYTLETFVNACLVALNDAGSLTYTATIDRSTRKITLTGSANFDLLVTGTHSAISAFTLMGFTSDKTGSNSYTSDIASGFYYEPQYKLQRFVDFVDKVESVQSSVNTSASGIVEVVSYGTNQFMECNITYATNITGQGAIKNNPTGVSDLRAFMNYAIKKKPMEFIPDVDTPSVYTSCILEKTPANTNGTSFTLNELYGRGLANYFETGTLTFREI